eukprot:GHVU01131787.1.p1 GENE.GHVU01131787.1~~GHVU01131787.1.p1  ORF type:complete len:285 (-),score=43.52 GHVU01131787.1:668-1522(-)
MKMKGDEASGELCIRIVRDDWSGLGVNVASRGLDMAPLLLMSFSSGADALIGLKKPMAVVAIVDEDADFFLRIEGNISPDNIPLPFFGKDDLERTFIDAIIACTGVDRGRISLPRGLLPGSVVIPTVIQGGQPAALDIVTEFEEHVKSKSDIYGETEFHKMTAEAGLGVRMVRTESEASIAPSDAAVRAAAVREAAGSAAAAREKVVEEEVSGGQNEPFHLSILKGRGMKGMDVDGSSDPYCKLTWRKDVYETGVQGCTLEPEWNETFALVYNVSNGKGKEGRK